MGESPDEMQIDILRAIKAAVSKWFIILLAVTIAGGFAYFYFRGKVEVTYSTSGKIYVLDRDDKSLKVSIEQLNIGSQLVEDYKALVTSRLVLETVIDKLDLDISYTDLADSITIENPEDTRIIMISLTYDNEAKIKQILNTIEVVICTILADKLGTEHPSIIEKACEPTKTYTISPVKKSALCAIAAGVVLAGIFALMDIINNKVRFKDEIEGYHGLALLADIPYVPNKRFPIFRR